MKRTVILLIVFIFLAAAMGAGYWYWDYHRRSAQRALAITDPTKFVSFENKHPGIKKLTVDPALFASAWNSGLGGRPLAVVRLNGGPTMVRGIVVRLVAQPQKTQLAMEPTVGLLSSYDITPGNGVAVVTIHLDVARAQSSRARVDGINRLANEAVGVALRSLYYANDYGQVLPEALLGTRLMYLTLSL